MRLGGKLSSFTRTEVSELFSRARAKARMPGLRILVHPSLTTTKEYGRILIVIPRRVGNAPERNLIRRRIKSIFFEDRLYQYRHDSIVLVGPECAQLSFAELRKVLTTTLSRS